MKFAVVYGTRPEFLKLKLLIDALKPVVIRIEQHKDYTEDTGYPHHVVHVKQGELRLSSIGESILTQLPLYIQDCTHIIAQGDTASCFYSLLCAYQMKKTCIHIEAGMRTYDVNNPWPEETYRQMISRLTSIHFCPSIHEAHILGSEHVHGKIFITGNTILDLVKSYQIPVTREKKVLVTLHRRENWHNYRCIIQRINTLAKDNTDIEFIFLTHPNPELKEIVEEEATHLHVMDSVSHRKLIEILSACSCVITDSGGIQEEANFLGKHIYVLRETTERTLIKNCTINPSVIDVKNPPIHEPGYEYGHGDAVEKIISFLMSP